MTIAFPTAPLAQNIAKYEMNDSNFDKDGFHKPIMGTAIAVWVNAHNIITQSSNVTCDREYTHTGYNPIELSDANRLLSKKTVDTRTNGSR